MRLPSNVAGYKTTEAHSSIILQFLQLADAGWDGSAQLIVAKVQSPVKINNYEFNGQASGSNRIQINEISPQLRQVAYTVWNGTVELVVGQIKRTAQKKQGNGHNGMLRRKTNHNILT